MPKIDDEQIDDEQYRLGKKAFEDGCTLRHVVVRASEEAGKSDPGAEMRFMSFALGFADALLDKLRAAGQ